MVSEAGSIVEASFTPGTCSDVPGMRCYTFDLPEGSVVYADKAYCNYAIEDVLGDIDITFKLLRKKTPNVSIPFMKSIYSSIDDQRQTWHS